MNRAFGDYIDIFSEIVHRVFRHGGRKIERNDY